MNQEIPPREDFKEPEELGDRNNYLAFERKGVKQEIDLETLKGEITNWVERELSPLILEIGGELGKGDVDLASLLERPAIARVLQGFKEVIRKNSETVSNLSNSRDILELMLGGSLKGNSNLIKERVIELAMSEIRADLEDIAAAA